MRNRCAANFPDSTRAFRFSPARTNVRCSGNHIGIERTRFYIKRITRSMYSDRSSEIIVNKIRCVAEPTRKAGDFSRIARRPVKKIWFSSQVECNSKKKIGHPEYFVFRGNKISEIKEGGNGKRRAWAEKFESEWILEKQLAVTSARL